jgi:hypothetical protein
MSVAIVMDTCLVDLKGTYGDAQSLSLEVPRMAAPARKHLTWGTQEHNQQNAASMVYMTNKREENGVLRILAKEWRDFEQWLKR